MGMLEKLAATGDLTDAQVSHIQETVREFEKLAEDPEFLEEALEKVAVEALGGIDLKGTKSRVLATIIATAAAAGAADAYKTTKRVAVKAHNYRKLLEVNPTLANLDKRDVRTSFNTLSRVNPTYAADPVIAGSFVRKFITEKGRDFQSLKSFVDQSTAPPSLSTGPSYFPDATTLANAVRYKTPTPVGKK